MLKWLKLSSWTIFFCYKTCTFMHIYLDKSSLAFMNANFLKKVPIQKYYIYIYLFFFIQFFSSRFYSLVVPCFKRLSSSFRPMGVQTFALNCKWIKMIKWNRFCCCFRLSRSVPHSGRRPRGGQRLLDLSPVRVRRRHQGGVSHLLDFVAYRTLQRGIPVTFQL